MGKIRKRHIGLISRTQELKVTDLMDKAVLQALQDQFTYEYRDYRVGNGLLDVNAAPITFERGHCAYCRALRKTEEGYSLCRKSDKVIIEAIRKSRSAYWRVCEGGLIDFGAPILIEGRVVAFFFWGQIRSEYCKTRSNGIKHVLKRLGIRKARDGRRDSVPARLQKRYYKVTSRSEIEILEIAKGGLGFAERLNGILSKLVQWEKPREVDEFVARMVREHDLDSLFDLCVREIPRLLETRDCSILTVIRGSAEAEPRLVLQKTSYKKSKDQEGRGSYAEGEGLTGWVWKNRCALRLADINDPTEVGRYPSLEWRHIIDDSGIHKEWLGVPLFGRTGEVIGVIRVPAKRRIGGRAGGGFDFRDEICLMMVGQSVAHEIEVLRQRERTLAALKISQECAVKLCWAEDQVAIAKTVVDASVKIFGENGKAHFFNVFSKDDGKLRVQEIRGTLTADWMIGKELPDDSLSARCINGKEEKIIHNIPKALSEGYYFDLAERVECAMSVPIHSGNEVFGALSVGADRQYEFTEEPDLHILRDMASITAATFARLDAEELAQQGLRETVRGVTHTLGNRIPTLENWLSLLQQKAGEQFAEEINRLKEGVDFIIGAIDAAKQFGRLSGPVHMQSFELAPVLQRLQRLYSDKRIYWKIQSQLLMLGDPVLIEQAVLELLVNSLRFVDDKTGVINVSVYHRKIKLVTGSVQNAVIIRVDNNGPGIPADQKKNIFRPAITADPAAHFGLGLSFVQSVAQRHGGYAEECGNVAKGASFRVIFPQ